MKINEFQELSKRTAPFNAQPTSNVELWNVLANYSVGLVGEHLEYELELKKVPLGDEDISDELLDAVDMEIGDTLHYAVNLLTILGEEYDESRILEDVDAIMIKTALKDILELHKKYIYHGHILPKYKFVQAIYVIISQFVLIYNDLLSPILIKNIEKLRIRYPEAFSVEDSIARVDVK